MVFTDEQKALIDNDSTSKKVHISFPNHEIESIENDRIYEESMSLEESIIDQGNFVIGKCNSALFKVKVADFTENIDGAKIDVSITLSNESLDTSMDLPIGKYIVASAERTADRRWKEITACDYMSLFDRDISDWYNKTLYPTTDTTHTMDEILSMLCSYVGVRYNADFNLMHGNLVVGKNIEPTGLSARDFLQQICEANAVFAHFDELGVLQFISLDALDTTEPTLIDIYRSCDYEDYYTKPCDAVQIRLENGDVGVISDNADSANNIYTITGNSFLFGLTAVELKEVANNILNAISGIYYRPNTTDVKGALYIGLGTVYQVNTNNDTIKSYVLKRTLSGIQSLFSQFEASESDTTSDDTGGITTEISILKGKSAVLKKDMEGITAEFKDYEKNTNAKIEATADNLAIVLSGAYGSDYNLLQNSETFIGFKILRKACNDKGEELATNNNELAV